MSKREVDVRLQPKPEEPLQSDCCGNGCTPCVFDIYREELHLWEEECERIRYGGDSSAEKGPPAIAENLPVLSKSEYCSFHLSAIKQESRDSYIFNFELPHGRSLGLSAGQHIILRVIDDDKVIIRQYTPISSVTAEGYFELLIKIYHSGRMSHYMNKLQPGDRVECRGPCGNFTYQPNQWQRIYMLAAGTGIAPMAQIIQQVISNEEDETILSLIYTCRTYEDLLLRSQLDEWSAYWNVNILYILTQDTEDRVGRIKKYGEEILCGRVTSDLLSTILTDKPPRYHVLVCGTPSFEKDMITYLQISGHPPQSYHKF